MEKTLFHISYIVFLVAAVALLIALFVIKKRMHVLQEGHRKFTQRSAEKVASLKTRIAELESAIRKKIIHEKTDRELLDFFNDLLSKYRERSGTDPDRNDSGGD